MLLGGAPVSRPRLARPARGRDVRRSTSWTLPTTSPVRSPGCCYKTAVVDDLAAARALVAEAPDVTAVTRDGDVFGAHFAAGGSSSQPSLIEIQAAVDEADRPARRGDRDRRAARVRHLPARGRAARGPAARRRRPRQAPRVRRHAGRGGRGARPVRLPGPRRPRRGRAARRGHRRRPRRPATPTSPVWPSSRRGSPPPRTPPTRSPTPPSASGSPRPPARRGRARWTPGSALRTAEERARALHGRADQLARAARPSGRPAPAPPSAASGCSARAGPPRRSASRSASCCSGSRCRCTVPPRPGRRSRRAAAEREQQLLTVRGDAARPRPRARRAGQLRPPRRDGPRPAADADRAARGACARGARPRRATGWWPSTAPTSGAVPSTAAR